MHLVRESCRAVVQQSEHVSIDTAAIDAFCRTFRPLPVAHWVDCAPFNIRKLGPGEQEQFLLINAALAFCFWGEPKWTMTYRGMPYDGYFGMVAAFGKAHENGEKILDASFLAHITDAQLADMFAGTVAMPLLLQRVLILRELGEVLIADYERQATNIIAASRHDAVALRDILVNKFSFFNDTAIYHETPVLFHKKAQFLAGDIAALASDSFTNVDDLTAPADYKLPQALRKLGILKYTPRLASRIDALQELPRNSEEEIEIRAATIWAVHQMTQTLRHLGHTVMECDVGGHLWLLGQQKSPSDKPYHRTRSIFY